MELELNNDFSKVAKVSIPNNLFLERILIDKDECEIEIDEIDEYTSSGLIDNNGLIPLNFNTKKIILDIPVVVKLDKENVSLVTDINPLYLFN